MGKYKATPAQERLELEGSLVGRGAAPPGASREAGEGLSSVQPLRRNYVAAPPLVQGRLKLNRPPCGEM